MSFGLRWCWEKRKDDTNDRRAWLLNLNLISAERTIKYSLTDHFSYGEVRFGRTICLFSVYKFFVLSNYLIKRQLWTIALF